MQRVKDARAESVNKPVRRPAILDRLFSLFFRCTARPRLTLLAENTTMGRVRPHAAAGPGGTVTACWTANALAAAGVWMAVSVAAQSQPQPTPCFRWAGQAAIANKPGEAPGQGVNASTLWYYGGQAMTSQGQTSNLWTNALVALPLDQGAQLYPHVPRALGQLVKVPGK